MSYHHYISSFSFTVGAWLHICESLNGLSYALGESRHHPRGK